jgi:hypothetical protein
MIARIPTLVYAVVSCYRRRAIIPPIPQFL